MHLPLTGSAGSDHARPLLVMEREAGNRPLHRQLMGALVRATQALEHSRLLTADHKAIDADLKATLDKVRRNRQQRARGQAFAFRQADDRDRFRSG